jgi:hypothetical protein
MSDTAFALKLCRLKTPSWILGSWAVFVRDITIFRPDAPALEPSSECLYTVANHRLFNIDIVSFNRLEPTRLPPTTLWAINCLIYLPVEAPESVANETIDRSKCSWRQTRWFKSIEAYNVDIEKTMVCDSVKTFGRWFKCRCVGTKDCYVSNKYRPGAKDSRRCFQTA